MGPRFGKIGDPINVFSDSLSQILSGANSGVTPATIAAFRGNGPLLMGELQMVDRNALTTAISEYQTRVAGKDYYPWRDNSNTFVNEIFKKIGARPHVPRAFAPAF
jgi:hypothetical protein